MVQFFLLLVSLLLCTNGALASFNTTYLRRHKDLSVCGTPAKLVETNVSTTKKSMSINFGKCEFNMTFVANTAADNGVNFDHYTWVNETRECDGQTFNFARLHCHHNKLDRLLDQIRRRNDRCYLDIGNTAEAKKCVYEQRGNWNLLDWLFPIAILLAVFGCTCCCCLKNRIRKAGRPRGPILDTEPGHPDAAYDARNSPFQ